MGRNRGISVWDAQPPHSPGREIREIEIMTIAHSTPAKSCSGARARYIAAKKIYDALPASRGDDSPATAWAKYFAMKNMVITANRWSYFGTDKGIAAYYKSEIDADLACQHARYTQEEAAQ